MKNLNQITKIIDVLMTLNISDVTRALNTNSRAVIESLVKKAGEEPSDFLYEEMDSHLENFKNFKIVLKNTINIQ